MITTQEGTKKYSGNKVVPVVESLPSSGCCAAIRSVLSRVGDKWSMMVVSLLSRAPVRFNELRRRTDGISQRMLTRTLRELERDGMIIRTVKPSIPPQVEYRLTALGYSLLKPVENLIEWTKANYPSISKAQEVFDKRSQTPVAKSL